jgi:hypothetical protein
MITLSVDHERYVEVRPSRDECMSLFGTDRSMMELQIATALCRRGLHDEQIVVWFNEHRLSKHQENKDADETWLKSLIATARNSISSWRPPEDQEPTPHPLHVISEIDPNPANKRTYRDAVLPYRVLQGLRAAEEAGLGAATLTKWRQEIVNISELHSINMSEVYAPVSVTTAKRLSNNLIKFGYVQTEKIDGKRKAVLLTSKGLRWSMPARGRWSRSIVFPSMSRKDSPVVHQPPAPVEKVRRKMTLKARRAVPISTRRARHQFNNHYRLWFGGRTVRYVQLLTPPEQWLAADLWSRLAASHDEHGPRYIAAGPDDGDDPLLQVVPWPAKAKHLAAAVELKRLRTGRSCSPSTLTRTEYWCRMSASLSSPGIPSSARCTKPRSPTRSSASKAPGRTTRRTTPGADTPSRTRARRSTSTTTSR